MDLSQKEKNIIYNALLAYADILSAVELGCTIPKRFQPLSKLTDSDLIEQRMTVLSLLKNL